MASNADRTIFVNLAVADLARAVTFFTELGFAFDDRFTDDGATCMIVSDHAFVMLLVHARFAEFTTKTITNSATHTEAILSVGVESPEAVDRMVDTALRAGGSMANEPMDHDFMYGRSFHDPDGHLWEIIWMDPDALADDD